jgi:carboxyl-terminal processing protease
LGIAINPLAISANDQTAGYRSPGKGLVQKQFQVSDSLALLLSTARNFTLSGRSIQRNYNSVTQNYHNDMSKFCPDSAPKISSPSPLLFYTASTRPVSDNEGITPDICLNT